MKNLCKTSVSKIVSSCLDTPIGLYTIKVCGTGVHEILLSKPGDENSKVDLNSVNEVPDETQNKVLQDCKLWLENYFQKGSVSGSNSLSSIKSPEICYNGLEATDFELKVWKTLQATKMGETLSYGELANLVQNPKAARAVGSAMKKNPITILIPCHRVIRSDFSKSGTFGNYSGGGPQNKEWLINHEKLNL